MPFPTGKFINVRGQLMDLSRPRVMGIINLTPDSFYDGGKIKSDSDLLQKVEGMLSNGADILDIGAYSSRPGADDVPQDLESQMSSQGCQVVLREFPEAILSIDSFRSTVAKTCLDQGASIINDISGGDLDQNMFDLVVEAKVPYILMHMRGNPRTMIELTDYDDLPNDIINHFNAKVSELNSRGVSDIILDPGFGFAKTKEQSFELLNKLELLHMLERPLLCGVSRKSMIYKTLDSTPEEALNGTTALNMSCLMKGASILRVHDVKEAKETILLFEAMTNDRD